MKEIIRQLFILDGEVNPHEFFVNNTGGLTMVDDQGKYNIKVISTMLGIQPGTLRAWERRYNIIEPIRNDSGHRLYSDEHVAILSWLLDKVSKGFTIGQAVGLLENGNADLETKPKAQYDNKLHLLKAELEECLLNFQEFKANRILDEAFSLFSIERVVLDVLSPFVDNIEIMIEKAEITVAHEKFILHYLRTRLEVIFNYIQTDSLLPKVITVCGPREVHELRLLIFTFYLRKKGFHVIYLGTGIPMADLKSVIKEVNPDYLFLSCTKPENIQEALSAIHNITLFKNNLNIGLFGKAVNFLSNRDREDYKRYIVGFLKEEWDEWLKNSQNKKS